MFGRHVFHCYFLQHDAYWSLVYFPRNGLIMKIFDVFFVVNLNNFFKRKIDWLQMIWKAMTLSWHHFYELKITVSFDRHGPLLLTWFNFNPNMDK